MPARSPGERRLRADASPSAAATRGARDVAASRQETGIDFLRFLADLAHLPGSWRQWVVVLATLLVMLAILSRVEGEIAVVYLFVVLLAGGVVMSFWDGKPRGGRRGPR